MNRNRRFLLRHKYGFSNEEILLYGQGKKGIEGIENNFVSETLYKELRQYLENSRWKEILHNKWLSAKYFQNSKYVNQPKIVGLLHAKSGINLYGDPLRSFQDLISILEKEGLKKIAIKHIGGGIGKSVFIVNKVLTENGSKVLYLADGGILNEQNFGSILEIVSGNLKGFIVEEKIDTHDLLTEITSGGLCSIRIYTLRLKDGNCLPKVAFIRLGTKDSPTDHASNGGVMSAVDMKTGKLGLGLLERDFEPHIKVHPSSGLNFYGKQIPYWKECKQIVSSAASQTHGVNWIGWDIVVGKHKPYMIEGNVGGGLKISQRLFGGFKENGILDEWIEHLNIPVLVGRDKGELNSWKKQFLKKTISKVIGR